ncbi:MAG: hypothetical protein UR87_C0010G0011 [candidate division CPR3 bacterium GW2011_GWE2_35_7]|nr:MAG: hypothetical protein UR87_C0010G0011 [candidate division CPR3 bacterium GW2011_GWE2_35_7]
MKKRNKRLLSHTRKLSFSWRLLVITLMVIFTLSVYTPTPNSAATYSFSNKDLTEGISNFNNIDVSTQGEIKLQSGDVGSWETDDGLLEPPILIYGDTEIIYGPNDSLYLITQGYVDSGRTFFLKYSLELKTWETLEAPPSGIGTGVALTWDKNDTMYLLPAGGKSEFYKYSLSENIWTVLPDHPQTVNAGTDVIYVETINGNYLYGFRGSVSTMFWRYNITSNQWEQMASFPVSVPGYGISLTWDNNDTIYALAGCNGEFRKYSIANNIWEPRLTVPPNNNVCQKTQIMLTSSNTILKLGIYVHGDISYLQQYNISNNQWVSLSTPPTGQTYDWGVTAVFDGVDTIYTLLGMYQHPILYSYSVSTDNWNVNGYNLYDPNYGYAHGAPIYDGDNTIYYVSGQNWGSLTDIYKMDLTTKVRTKVGSYPISGARAGIAGIYKDNALYLASWYGNTIFYKFDLINSTWATLATFPYATTYGCDMIDGEDGYIYYSPGGRVNFYRYDIINNTWGSLTSAPIAIGSGGGIEKIGADIYAFSGGGTPYFMKYDVAGNTWTTLPINIPNGSVEHGGVLVGDTSRYLYFVPANRTSVTAQLFYRYDTTDSSWKRLANLPSYTQVAAYGFYDNNTNRVYVSPTAVISHMWYWTTATDTYVADGVWYSKSIDLTHVQAWSTFQTSITGTGTVTAYSRTSNNGRIWDQWLPITGGNIQSLPKRYLQFKLALHGDTLSTPTVSNIQFTYEEDVIPPNLPSQFVAKGTATGETLTTGQTYEYQHPYFEWNGANDGNNGSGIAGYYVYYGTNVAADPEVDGSFQANNTYVVTSPMTSGDIYYVRIKVKDNKGNVSAIQTFFSYRYWYISPPESQLTTSYEQLSQGTNTNLDLITEEGSASLKKLPYGSWSEGSFTSLPDYATGSASVVIGDYLYIARGNNTTNFWRYNLVSQTWDTNLPPLPATAYIGSSLVWDQEKYIYYIRGNSTNGFYRYDIVNQIWDAPLSNLPVNASYGTDMEYIGNNKILFVFSGNIDFYEYNTETGGWGNLTSLPTTINTYYSGSGIWYDGGDSLYVNFGTSDWYQRGLAKYTISTDTWRWMATPPYNFWYVQSNLAGDSQGNLYIFGQDFMTNGYATAFKYNIATDTWKAINSGFPISSWGSLSDDRNRYIYIIPGLGNTRRILQYDTWNSKFTSLGYLQPPSLQRRRWDLQNGIEWYAGQATTATFDGEDNVYIINRNESDYSYLLKYSTSKNEFTYLPPPPYIGIGGSIAYSNGYLYYEPGRSRTNFYRFDFGKYQWEKMTDTLNTIYRPGASSLVVDKNGYLYLPRGNDNQFYRYTPDVNGGTWESLRAFPANILNASFVYDGDNYIYALRSNGSNAFYQYDIFNNSWTTLANFPVTTTYGNTMVMQQGKIYAMRGNAQKNMYVYDIATNQWVEGTSSPDYFAYGGNLVKISESKALAIPGQDNPHILQFNFPSATTGYQGLGVHISQPMEVSGLFDYAGIKAEVSIPENTDIEFYTRTSIDGNTWNEWELTDQIKLFTGELSTRVASQPQKYLQLKVIMYSYDNVYTPKLSSYALDYYFDVTPPTNPTITKYYTDDTKTTELETNKWYNYAKPYFDWPDPGEAGGATDGLLGSHIKGYYVSFSTDPSAVPLTSGVFTENSYYEANLTTSNTYYFSLQAVDYTGNIDSNIFTPIIYKFDNIPPDNPPMITVTPSGFTTINKYTFEWPNAYQGIYATEKCQTGLLLTDIPAMYTNGTNTFYLRAKDVAGNFASSYMTASYYFSNDPPSKVTNLAAIPPISTMNMFAFTWDLPAMFSGSADLLTYCYAINAEPPLSYSNTTCTSNRYISPFRAATKRGVNILSVIALDEAGNANWLYPATINFTANTISPGIPMNLIVSDTSDQANVRWSLTLTWDAPAFKGNGIDHYIVWRAENGANIFNQIGKVSDTAYVDLRVNTENTYTYKVSACDSVDNCGGESSAFTKRPEGVFNFPPKVNSGPTVKAGSDRAEIVWVTERDTEGAVYIGLQQNDLKRDRDHEDLRKEHIITITDLSPKTTYYYKVLSIDKNKNYLDSDAFSPIYSFQTQEAPRIYDVIVDQNSITQNSAMVTWKSTVPTKSKITYGKNLNYELTPIEGLPIEGETVAVLTHFYEFSNLESSNDSSIYHFKIIADTEFGTIITSDDYSFNTLPYPEITNITFQPIADQFNSVQVNWRTNIPTDSFIIYDGGGLKKEVAKSDLETIHSMTINDLFSNTEYSFIIKGRDRYGVIVTSTVQRWTSQIDTRPPVMSDLIVEISTTGVASNARSQIIVSWKTDEPSTSQIRYSIGSKEDLVNESPLDTETTTSHVVVLSNLPIEKIYKIQPLSTDLTGNISYGERTVAIASEPEYSMLDIIIDLFEKILKIN